MSHSFCRNIIHLVFSTQYRQPLITNDIRRELHAYMIGVLRNLESPSIRINSVETHAHLLFLLSKKQALEYVIEEVKRATSKWIKTKDPAFARFYWQEGYGAFSIGQEEVKRLTRYIDGQALHHQEVSFEDEIRALFRQAGQRLDEVYFFEQPPREIAY